MDVEDFFNYSETQAKHMSLFSNCLTILCHNIEEFVWFVLQPALTPEAGFALKSQAYDFFSLAQKINLLVGNIVDHGGRLYQIRPAKIKPDLFSLLTALRKRRNVGAHEAGFLYDKLMDLDNLFAPFGHILLTLSNESAACTVQLNRAVACPTLSNPDNVERNIAFSVVPPNIEYNLVECDHREANIILTFWKKKYYNYNHPAVESVDDYLIELQYSNSLLLFSLPKAQMTKIKAKLPVLKYNYGSFGICYKFEKRFLFQQIARFSHPSIKP
jgi:hypothetical protein